MQGVNVTRGLFRLWLVASATWLALVGFVIWQDVRTATQGRYQFIVQMRDGVSNPSDEESISKPFLEVFRRPSEGKFPPAFDRVEYRYQDGFDASVKAGNMVLVDFPDSTSLYVNTAFEKADQDLVARLFWDARWQRRWTAFRDMSGIVLLALIPPLLLLGLWFVGRWVVAGFRRPV